MLASATRTLHSSLFQHTRHQLVTSPVDLAATSIVQPVPLDRAISPPPRRQALALEPPLADGLRLQYPIAADILLRSRPGHTARRSPAVRSADPDIPALRLFLY